MISKEQVQHIAKLARIGLSEEEAEKFTSQLGSIIDYVTLLQEVDVENVQPTSQVTGLSNVSRKDEVKSNFSRDEMLSTTELPVEQDQIKVKSVFKI